MFNSEESKAMNSFTKITATIAIAGTAVLGLAACSTPSNSSSSSSSSSNAQLVGPTAVLLSALNGSTQTLTKVGDILYINIGDDPAPQNWSATISNPAVLKFTPGTPTTTSAAGTAPTFTALSSGTTQVTMKNSVSGATSTFTVTVK